LGQKGIIKNSVTADVSAEKMAAVFHAFYGKSGIMDAFNDLACTKINDNSVQLDSGVYSLKGFVLEVEPGTTITLTIDSGTAGQNRNDLIVAELVKNGGGVGIDVLQFKVVKGTSTSGTAVDPTLTQQDVNSTGVTRQEALYRVKVIGVTITAIERVASVIDNFDTLDAKMDARTIVESGGNETDGYYTKYGNGDVEFWGQIGFTGTFATGSAVSFTKTFPFACINTPKVVLTASMYDGTSAFTAFRVSAHLNGTNLNNFFGHAYCEYAASAQNYIGVHYQAKAKWK
jgi:hypothetical protein